MILEEDNEEDKKLILPLFINFFYGQKDLLFTLQNPFQLILNLSPSKKVVENLTLFKLTKYHSSYHTDRLKQLLSYICCCYPYSTINISLRYYKTSVTNIRKI